MHVQPVPQVMRTACTPLNTFFQVPVSGEEKRRRLGELIAGPFLFAFSLLCLSS